MPGTITLSTFIGVMIPFAGTTLGSACVFFLKGEMSTGIRKTLTGFAAVSWSLLPSGVPQVSWSLLPSGAF